MTGAIEVLPNEACHSVGKYIVSGTIFRRLVQWIVSPHLSCMFCSQLHLRSRLYLIVSLSVRVMNCMNIPYFIAYYT